MREIKFKLWHKGFKKFFTTNYSDQISMMPDGNIFWMGECETDNFTLLQYTGLKDINGKDIYEGDLLQHPNGTIAEIKYSDDLAAFVAVYTQNGNTEMDFLDKEIVNECEIVGNIYENPELLEVEGK